MAFAFICELWAGRTIPADFCPNFEKPQGKLIVHSYLSVGGLHLNLMARSTSTAQPLKTLREQATALEAAMLECLAKPAKRSVHKLRTSTRRIEAQLELLAMLPELPQHGKPREKLFRMLKKLRQAAGDVRDLDVQRDLISEATKKNSRGRTTDSLLKEAHQLRQGLKQKRDQRAEELLTVVKAEKADLPLAFNRLFDSLEKAGSLSISEADLTALIHTWYSQHTPAAPPEIDDVEHLHDIRKFAKLARYLAESAPKSAESARRLAARFEDLQEAGGQWHDWLVLAESARDQLGGSAQLPVQFAARAEKCLKSFERRIEKMSAHTAQARAA